MTRYFLCFITIHFCSLLFAQDAELPKDSLRVDTVPQHSVRKAVLFSAIVPGSGQIYNHIAMPKGKKKAYWKVPLIYAGLGATGYFFIKDNKAQHDLRKEYESRQSGNAPNLYLEYDSNGLLTLFEQKRTQRDLCILGFMGVYLLNVVDAAVEAHFVHFDVSENLSLSIHPAYLPGNAFGVGTRLSFHSSH